MAIAVQCGSSRVPATGSFPRSCAHALGSIGLACDGIVGSLFGYGSGVVDRFMLPFWQSLCCNCSGTGAPEEPACAVVSLPLPRCMLSFKVFAGR